MSNSNDIPAERLTFCRSGDIMYMQFRYFGIIIFRFFGKVNLVSTIYQKYVRSTQMFSDIFRQLLQDNHTTALQTAKDLHIPKSIVYEWKNGQRTPSAENMKKLAAYFHVSFAQLLGISETVPPDDSDNSEQELLLMLRTAREISPEDHNELVENMKRSLNLYLRAKRSALIDPPSASFSPLPETGPMHLEADPEPKPAEPDCHSVGICRKTTDSVPTEKSAEKRKGTT